MPFVYYFLQQEDLNFLTQEDGNLIIINYSGAPPTTSSVPFTFGLTSETTIYQNEVKCRVLENDFNYTQNPSAFDSSSFTVVSGSYAGAYYAPIGGTNAWGVITGGKIANNLTGSAFHPYATTIGLYNEANQLLVVGKFATPYPIPSNTDITFIVKWDS